METKNPTTQPNLQEQANAVDKKINKKIVIIICTAIVAIGAIVGLIFWYNSAQSAKADEAIGRADIELNDSIALNYYMEAAKLGHKSGNRAKLNVAAELYKKGEYEQAISYLDDASISSPLIDAGRLSLMGDCYVNLKQYDKAISCFDKAIKASDNNPQVIPFVLVKEANVYRELKEYDKEYRCYERIYNDYPEYAQRLNFDIRKYAERAHLSEGK